MIFDFIIVGAGISGSYAASKLNEHNSSVLILEKSRGIGGRCSTKPILNNIADYGCQYINPKTKMVKSIFEDLEMKKVVKAIELTSGKKVYISPYGMNKIPQYFSLSVPVLTNTKVTKIVKKTSYWMIKTNVDTFKCRNLISSIPTPQNLILFKDSKLEINYKNIPLIDYKSFFTITFISNSKNHNIISNPNENFSWICNNTLKGLRNKSNVLTVNTSTFLTKKLLELKKNQIKIRIEKKLRMMGMNNLINLSIHFWKYAYSDNASEIDNYWDSQFNLGLCGDSFGMGKIDGAITSADSLVKKII
jgi:predicted NAD/FAD-dependent oxidoreductase